MSLFETLSDRRNSVRGDIDAILSKYDSDTAVLSEADQANLTDLKTDLEQLDARLGELAAFDEADARHDQMRSRRSLAAVTGPTAEGSLGERFAASQQFSAFARSGFVGDMAAFTSEFALVKSVDGNSKPFAGVSQIRDAAQPSFNTPILDSFSREATSTNNVWWLEYPEDDPVAAEVAEGAPKPEAAYAPVIREGNVVKWAHTLPVTEEALADIPRLRSILEGALVRGVRAKAEQTAAATLTGGTYTAASGDTLVAAVRYGIATVQDNGYMPSHIYVNPMDYAGLDLEVLAATLSGPTQNTRPWGLTYVASSAVAAGTAYVADAASAFLFIDRGVLQVAMTDSHAEEFTSNIYRLRAEARGKTVIQRASAVCEVSAAGAVAAASRTVKGK